MPLAKQLKTRVAKVVAAVMIIGPSCARQDRLLTNFDGLPTPAINRGDVDLSLTDNLDYRPIAKAGLAAEASMCWSEKPMAVELEASTRLMARTSQGFSCLHHVMLNDHRTIWKRGTSWRYQESGTAKVPSVFLGPALVGKWFYERRRKLFDTGIYNVVADRLLGPYQACEIAMAGICILALTDDELTKVDADKTYTCHRRLGWGVYRGCDRLYDQQYQVPGIELYGSTGAIYERRGTGIPAATHVWQNIAGCSSNTGRRIQTGRGPMVCATRSECIQTGSVRLSRQNADIAMSKSC